MAMEIVKNTLNEFNWIHVSPETLPDSELRKLDMSNTFAEMTGVSDASVFIFPYQNFGDISLLRLLIHKEAIDGILIFHDPRYWDWLFDHEHEIRQYVPIMFYNIWDNTPIPHFNKGYYESVDGLIAISKFTEHVNRQVLDKSKYKVNITRVPHGVNENIFYPITQFDPHYDDFIRFKSELVGDTEFVVLFNSRNMDRKNPMGIIEAFNKFNQLCTLNAKLVMHTNPIDPVGTDLVSYVAHNVRHKENILWSTKVLNDTEMNYLYNSADITISLSHTEGWGLSLTESGMAGTPILAIKTGGMTDQLFENCTFGMEPEVRSLAGSIPTPYIHCDRVSVNTVVDELEYAFTKRDKLESMGYELRAKMIEAGFTTKLMGEGIANSINHTLSTFQPKPDFAITKI